MKTKVSPTVVDHFVPLPRFDSTLVTTAEAERFAAYLVDPVSTGLWRLHARWTKQGAVGAVWSALEREFAGKDSLSINSGKRERRFRIDADWKDTFRENVTETISFPMSLFDYFATLDRTGAEEPGKFSATHEHVQLVLDLIDATPIREAYATAVSLFRERVLCPDFTPVFGTNEAVRARNGLFFVESSPRDSGIVCLQALDRAPLNDLAEFFEAAGIASDPVLLPVYSPEEEVFAPYFNLLKLAASAVIRQSHLRPVIDKAIRYLEEGGFADCIVAIGLAAEDVLTQIYETLYRTQLTRGVTLGQLVDNIGARARALQRKPQSTPPDLSTCYAAINAAISDEALSVKRCVELSREMLTRQIEAHTYILRMLQQAKAPEHTTRIWPPHIDHAVEELIRYRNAASHKSRVPLGQIECRRSMHNFVKLHSWWEAEKRAIDWDLPPDKIVATCVERSLT